MVIDPILLSRYLRQRRELGEGDLFFSGLSAGKAISALASAPAHAQVGMAAGAAPSTAPAVGAGAPSTPAQAEASGLAALGGVAATCTRCRLHETRRSVVFGDGPASAEVMVVGEAPGAEEDRTGRPFVGPAGRLLDLLLESVGFPRARVYICNVLKCRPPGNRDPRPDEVDLCSGYLNAQLDLIRPLALLAVGRFAAQTLLGSDQPMSRLRGRIGSVRGVPAIATYHPAYLLRSPRHTMTAWEDLQSLRRMVDESRN